MALRAPGPALVTGASSGIGAAFARSLAARGYDLILAARREDRLRALAAELADRHGIDARVVACDLATEPGLAACRAACDAGPAPDVAILNAGFGSLGALADLDRRREADMARLNCVAVVDLAGHVLPGMIARRRGAIVVIASAAAYQPIPGMVTYAATKAFDLRFAQGLASELTGSGVRALAVCPGPTHTDFGRAAGAGRIHPWIPHSSPERVVGRTWAALAAGRDRVDIGPLAAIARVGQAAPHGVVQAIAGRMHRARRRLALPPSERRT